MPVNVEKLKEMDSHWNEVMDLAKKYGFIVSAYAGTAVLATNELQLKEIHKDEDEYIRVQREKFGIDMAAGDDYK